MLLMQYIVSAIIIIICTFCALFYAQIKGFFGEKRVSCKLRCLPRDKYRILNNIILKTEYGTTQIDHIVISVYGIFVVETKNYAGWITGTEDGEQWTKNMYGNKYSFRNPIKQNYAHIKALEQNLELSKDKFISIVVFLQGATIKVSSKKHVIYLNQLLSTIEQYKEMKFTQEQMLSVIDKLEKLNTNNKEMRKTHVAQINKRVSYGEDRIAAGRCPKCDGFLIQRKGKYGEFKGCSNYPKCRFTIKG